MLATKPQLLNHIQQTVQRQQTVQYKTKVMNLVLQPGHLKNVNANNVQLIKY